MVHEYETVTAFFVSTYILQKRENYLHFFFVKE